MIKNRSEADKVINQIGANMIKLDALKTEIDLLKKQFDVWAYDNPEVAFDDGKKSGNTDKFSFYMTTKPRSLNCDRNLTKDDVVALLKKSETMRVYVTETYDSEAIKADFASSAAKREAIQEYGLFFSNPRPHVTVESL